MIEKETILELLRIYNVNITAVVRYTINYYHGFERKTLTKSEFIKLMAKLIINY